MTEYTDDEYREICWGDHEDYDTIVNPAIIDQTRWSVVKEMTVLNNKTKKFYNISWMEPATEYQENDPDYVMYEVMPKEVTTVIYEKV